MQMKSKKSGIQNDTITLEIQGKPFDIPLCIKEEAFGNVKLFHFWMDRRLIYGQRGNSTQLNETLSDCYWEICKAENVTDDPENRERYLLARLCPYMRGNASKKVFNDASITVNPKFMGILADQVEPILAASRNDELTPIGFWEKTKILLGPPEWPEETETRKRCYGNITAELFEQPCMLLETDATAANREALKRLELLDNRYGRRAGYQDEKLILNMLSYESRVAVHDCSGEVWNALIRNFSNTGAMDPASVALHRFLHCHSKYIDSKTGEEFHLFHGQPFGLHPGIGLLFLTKTGRELLGEYVSNPSSNPHLNRLLHAIFICLYQYEQYHDDQAQKRKLDSVRKIGYEQATNAEAKAKTGDHREKPIRSNNY